MSAFLRPNCCCFPLVCPPCPGQVPQSHVWSASLWLSASTSLCGRSIGLSFRAPVSERTSERASSSWGGGHWRYPILPYPHLMLCTTAIYIAIPPCLLSCFPDKVSFSPRVPRNLFTLSLPFLLNLPALYHIGKRKGQKGTKSNTRGYLSVTIANGLSSCAYLLEEIANIHIHHTIRDIHGNNHEESAFLNGHVRINQREKKPRWP